MSEDFWNSIPNPNDFFITVVNWTYPKRFDVSAYLNARDHWVEELREHHYKILRGQVREAMRSNLAKENSQLFFDMMTAKGKIRRVRDWITNYPNYGEGGLEELEKIIT